MSVFSSILRRFSVLSLLLVFVFSVARGQDSVAAETGSHEAHASEEFNAADVILHHVMDDHIWHVWDGHYGTIFLPVIVYSSEKGLDVFSSKNFYDDHHNVVEYNGYKLEHNHILLAGTNE